MQNKSNMKKKYNQNEKDKRLMKTIANRNKEKNYRYYLSKNKSKRKLNESDISLKLLRKDAESLKLKSNKNFLNNLIKQNKSSQIGKVNIKIF